MGAILEWSYIAYSGAGISGERVVSLIICMAFNVYFLVYELYMYYEMIKYPNFIIFML